MKTTNHEISQNRMAEIRSELKKYRGSINMVAIKAGVQNSYASMVLSGYIRLSHANYKVIEKVIEAAIEVLKELREKDKQIEEKINQAQSINL